MLIYQDRYENYKETDICGSRVSSGYHFKQKAVKPVLKRKNIKFLASLGFTVKKQNGK